MSLPEISIRRPVFATVVIMALVLLGVVNYFKMSVDEMPDTSLPYVSVSIAYEGAQPEQVDLQVTQKIEEAVSEAKGVKHIESTSRDGEAEISIEFNFGINPDAAAQEVRDKISGIRGELPDGVKEPVIAKFDLKAAPIAALAVTGNDKSIRELSILVNDVIKPRLQKINGVGQLKISGAQEREIRLLLEQEKLNAFGFSPAELQQRLQESNQDIPAGKFMDKQHEVSLRTAGNFSTPDDYLATVAGIMNKQPVYYWQLGTVDDTVKTAKTIARYDNQLAISIEVGKQSGANTVEVAAQLKTELAQLAKQLPPSINIELVRNDAQRIEESIHEVWFDLLVGGFFAVLVVFVFLGDWRSTVISSIAIPASIAAAFLFMKLAGFSINTMSLLGLSLSVGLLIDDAIVVIENIIRHKKAGKSVMQAALDGSKEISLAVMATTFTVVAVFIPIGMMTGVEGEFFKEFGLSIAFAVMVSLFISFTLTPMLAANYFNMDKRGLPDCLNDLWTKWQKVMEWCTENYVKWLGLALKGYRKQVIVAVGMMFLGSLLLVNYIGSSYMPITDQSQFTVKIRMQAGTALPEIDARMQKISENLQKMPEIETIYVTASAQEQVFFIKLVSKNQRALSQNEVIREVRQRLNKMPGVFADIQQGEGKPVAVSITGCSLEQLEETAGLIREKMDSVPGVCDIVSSYRPGMPGLTLDIKEEQANYLGVSTADIGTTMRILLNGSIVGKFSDDEERIDVRMILAEVERHNAELLKQIMVPANVGTSKAGLVPLSQVAEWKFAATAADIRRYDRQKEIRLTANLENISLGEFNELFYPMLDNIKLPSGVQISGAGEADSMDESFNSMAVAMLLAVAFIFMILAAQFESYIEPLAIMLSLPLAIIGALAALFVTGSDLSLISLIGIMLLMGLVSKNAILLIDFAKQQLAGGVECKEALIIAGRVRLRPILMTSIAMTFGMLPIAAGLGPGAEARAPMAYTIIGGVFTSTLLTLVVVPVFYSIIYEWKSRFSNQKK